MKGRGKFAIDERRERMRQSLDIVLSLAPVEFKKAVATISLNIGVSKEKAREYILTYIDFGKLKSENGILKPREMIEAEVID